MTDHDRTAVCPFCGWTEAASEYEMLLHLETLHPDLEPEPSVDGVSGGSGGGDMATQEVNYVECPHHGCDAILELGDLESHLQAAHADGAQERSALKGVSPPPQDQSLKTQSPASPSSSEKAEAAKHRRPDRPSSGNDKRQSKSVRGWIKFLGMASPLRTRSRPPRKSGEGNDGEDSSAKLKKRLGMSELGLFAHEERMPNWLASYLRKHGQVVSHGIVDVVACLLDQSKQTEYAYVCHPSVQHISRLKYEGGFCGYRNIQMMCSYILGSKSKGHENLQKDNTPSIFEIQDWIETAWDNGINSEGRIETGGIKGTRKYIGTPEALAVFRLLDIPCDTGAIRNAEPSASEALLLKSVEDHFQSGVEDPTQRIRKTAVSPIYFQHRGHSLTIVGFERLKNGSKQLLVFDPSYHVSSNLVALAGKTFTHPHPDFALRSFRRGSKYLRRFKEFEILRVLPST
ncbi:hypothetical protein VTJ83DRAFT_5881 [Remersonia thermophila]|uniref:UFSP1/2/DUB catalytic domain-containing protein n=1 Tax=Remersonia thermophila TaxID=72144 RepID=A0ABR4D838_9PEZI